MLYFLFPIQRLELVILLNVDSSVPAILAVHPVIAPVVSTSVNTHINLGGEYKFSQFSIFSETGSSSSSTRFGLRGRRGGRRGS
jgi:hypothetical protein